MMLTKTAAIIGNGKSRLNFDLSSIQHTTFGCNALYRDYTPDFLVAIDPHMIEEIRNSGFPPERFIVPALIDQYEPREYLDYPIRPRSNAGMNAMQEAIRRGYNSLLCLGFDFLLQEDEYATGNVYRGSVGYVDVPSAGQEDNRSRRRYLDWFIAQHPNVSFQFVFPDEPLHLILPKASNVTVRTTL